MKNNHLQQFFNDDFKLAANVQAGDKIITTNQGVFKIRKNGRVNLTLSPHTDYEEQIKVTPL